VLVSTLAEGARKMLFNDVLGRLKGRALHGADQGRRHVGFRSTADREPQNL
jgi:hypothetical protein